MRRGLLISFCFPPDVYAESIIVAKKLGNLSNITFDVVSIDTQLGGVGKDPDLLSYAEKKFNKIIRYTPPELYFKLPVSRLAPIFSMPDMYRWLLPKIYKLIPDMESYDFIFSWSNYLSAHLLALQLKKNFPDKKWVAHFSDPWVDNPFNHWRRLVAKVNQKLERKVYEAADLLFFTSEETIQLVSNRYSNDIKKKMKLSTHCYDSSLYPEQPKCQDDIKICYFGNFYGERSPLPLLEALVDIYKFSPDALNDVKFEFYGNAQTQISKESLYQQLPPGLLSIVAPVPYMESLALMKQSDILLIIDAPFDESVFLPSKLVDYIGARKLIFGITPPGTSARIIRELGGESYHPHDTKGIAQGLIAAITTSRLDRDKLWGEAHTVKQYSAPQVCSNVEREIECLLGDCRA